MEERECDNIAKQDKLEEIMLVMERQVKKDDNLSNCLVKIEESLKRTRFAKFKTGELKQLERKEKEKEVAFQPVRGKNYESIDKGGEKEKNVPEGSNWTKSVEMN